MRCRLPACEAHKRYEFGCKVSVAASSAIEPKIGHMKYGCSMGRNFLKYELGDKINAPLAGVGVNVRKLLAAFPLSLLFSWLTHRFLIWKQVFAIPVLSN